MAEIIPDLPAQKASNRRYGGRLMRFVSTSSSRRGLTIWVAQDGHKNPEGFFLTHAEAASLARDITTMLAAELTRRDEFEAAMEASDR